MHNKMFVSKSAEVQKSKWHIADKLPDKFPEVAAYILTQLFVILSVQVPFLLPVSFLV